MAIETPNPSVEGESISMFQLEGVQIFTYPQITHRVIKDQQITTFEPLDMFHYPGIKFNQKTRFGQKVGNFIL
jgi:hypothetical protein